MESVMLCKVQNLGHGEALADQDLRASLRESPGVNQNVMRLALLGRNSIH